MTEQDITKTGPIGLKGLKGLNQQSSKDFLEESRRARTSSFSGINPVDPTNPAYFTPQHMELNDPMADWGSSQYDTLSSSMSGNIDTLTENRYEGQSIWSAGANALVKMLGTAATTFMSGVAGLPAGIIQAADEGRISALWDNDLSKVLSAVESELEDEFKIYQSKEQQNASWLSLANLTSASFWGDDVIKNAGFMIGAAASGAIFSGGLGVASRALDLIDKATKVGRIVDKVAKPVAGIAGSLFSAAGEGAIEARQLMESTVELNGQRLDDELDAKAQAAYAEYMATGDIDLYRARLNDLEARRIVGKQQILEDARKAGNMDMALNIPILTLSNWFILGKAFTKSFLNARRGLANEVKSEGSDLITGVNKNLAKTAQKNAVEGKVTEGIESTIKEDPTWGKIRAFIKPIITEGSEEMNQQWASSASGFKYNREDVNDYWRARTHPGSEQEYISGLTALARGFGDSWGSFDQWEQFFVGGLMGGIGMPMPTKLFGSGKQAEDAGTENKKKRFNPFKVFSWEGGSFQSLREYKKKLDAATKLNEELNKRYKDPKFWNRLESGTAHVYRQATMDQAVEDDDIKAYKDSEEKQFVEDLAIHVKAGKVNDLIALIKATTQDLSDEDIAALINRNTIHITKEQDEANKKTRIQERIDSLTETLNSEETSPEDRLGLAMEIASLQQELSEVQGEEKYIGLYTDSNGNLTKSYDEIRQELQDNGNKLIERVKEYQASIAYVNALSQGKLTSDQEGNLAYLHYMGKAQKKRADKLMDKYEIPNSFVIRPGKDETIEVVQKALNLPEGSVVKNDNGTFTVNISSLEGDKKRDTFLSAALGHDRESVIENATNMVNAAEDKQTAFQDINDAIKLFLDSREFYTTFNEYMKDPTKVDEDKAKAEKEADKERNDANIDGKSVSEIVEGAENGDIDIDRSEFDFTDEEMDIINGKKPDATVTPEIERKQKVNTAREIRDTKNQAKAKARAMGLDDATIADLEAMIDKATSGAESADDVLDTETEAFNDPENLSTTEEEQQLLEVINDPNSSLEDVEAARQLYQESRQQRLDELKNIVQQIKGGVADDLEELKRMPKSGPNAPKSLGTMEDNDSKDPTEATPTTNKKNDSKEDIQEEETPTPDTQSLNPEGQPDSQPKQMPEKGYWKGNTTEYPIHRDKTNNKPFYEQIDDKTRQAISKAIYTFLKETGAYERIKNNEIKPGQKVRFAISKKLTNAINKATGQGVPVILVIDENGNVLCDLPCPACVTIFNKYPGLKEFYDEAVKYTNEHFNDNVDEDLIVIPNFESSISRPYIGRPLYSANNVRHTLNEIAQGRPFKMGIALTSSPNPTVVMTPGRRKAQGPSKEDLTIVKPESGLAGQPYLLIETSDSNRKWLTVPITMPTFNRVVTPSIASARLTRMVIEHLLKLTDPKSLATEEAQIAWKNGLKDLLAVGDVYLEVTPNTANKSYDIKLRVKRKKSDTAWNTVYEGPSNIDGSAIVANMEALSLPFQVSRKYINSQFNGQDYNSLIGELASTNLEIGALHTVNDFFTINPIINGKQQKAKPIQDAPRDAENKAKATRENTFVTGNIVPDQANVDRNRTDGSYYYIKESDGKYHKYQRVHNVLPVNSNNTGSANSQRALRTGSAIDTIVRDFFNTGKTTKPDFMSDEAYNSILKYLNTLNKWLKDHKWTVYANNIVLYNKYPDGRRIAGEVDLLLIDDKGNYHIYDVKTSAGSFTGDYFEGVHSNWGQIMSTKDYYTLQVSSYAKLLNDRFGKKAASVAIVPFNIVYGENDNVTGVTKVPNIALPIVDVDSNFKKATPEVSKANEAETNASFAVGDRVIIRVAGELPREGTVTKMNPTGKTITVRRDSDGREIEYAPSLLTMQIQGDVDTMLNEVDRMADENPLPMELQKKGLGMAGSPIYVHNKVRQLREILNKDSLSDEDITRINSIFNDLLGALNVLTSANNNLKPTDKAELLLRAVARTVAQKVGNAIDGYIERRAKEVGAEISYMKADPNIKTIGGYLDWMTSFRPSTPQATQVDNKAELNKNEPKSLGERIAFNENANPRFGKTGSNVWKYNIDGRTETRKNQNLKTPIFFFNKGVQIAAIGTPINRGTSYSIAIWRPLTEEEKTQVGEVLRDIVDSDRSRKYDTMEDIVKAIDAILHGNNPESGPQSVQASQQPSTVKKNAISSNFERYLYNTENPVPVVYIKTDEGNTAQVVWDEGRVRWDIRVIEKDGTVKDAGMDYGLDANKQKEWVHEHLNKEYYKFFESGEFERLRREDVRNNTNKLDEVLKNKFGIEFYQMQMDDYERAGSQTPESKPDTSEPKTSVATARENLGNNKLFKSQKWQNRLSRLNDENILGLNEMAKRNPILKRTLDHLDAKIKDNMSDEELNDLVAEQLKPKNREVGRTTQEQSSIDKEIEIIEKLLPQLSQEDRVRIVDSLISIPNGRAWGQFKDGAITLYRNAARGTSYHEAFHFVFNTLMTDEELDRAFDAAEKRYGKLSPIELEERLAEEFREYMQNEETFVGRLKNLWSKLKSLLNHFNSNWNYLDRVYADISRGNYSNREVRDNQGTRNRVVPTIPFMQDIVDSQVNNAAHTRTGKNKEWGRIADIWKKDGYRLRGHYDTQSKKYIVTSVTPIFTTKELRQYHANRLAYRNLDQESKDYLNERHITPQEYEKMTLKEKEVLFRCMY